MLIGISGKAYSGKDTFAKYLAEALYRETGLSFVMMAFATELKRKTKQDFDFGYEQLWGASKEAQDYRYPKDDGSHWTPREVMQNIGSFYRSIDPNYWINKLYEIMNEKKYQNVIITDIRYLNELNTVTDRGGVTVRINSPVKSGSSTHASEVELESCSTIDYFVDNFSDLENLKKEAIRVSKMIKERING